MIIAVKDDEDKVEDVDDIDDDDYRADDFVEQERQSHVSIAHWSGKSSSIIDHHHHH